MPIAGRCALDIEELLQETDETKPHVALSQEDISYFIYIFHGYMLSAALQGKQPLIRLRDWSWADYAECFIWGGGCGKMERED